jgi:hypothetical protein
VGQALLAIRDEKLYRGRYAAFEEYCLERWGFTNRRARMLMSAAEVLTNLQTGTMVPVLPTTERQARPLTRLEPEEQRAVWREAVDTAPGGEVTAAHVERVIVERQARQEATSKDAPGDPQGRIRLVSSPVTKPAVDTRRLQQVELIVQVVPEPIKEAHRRDERPIHGAYQEHRQPHIDGEAAEDRREASLRQEWFQELDGVIASANRLAFVIHQLERHPITPRIVGPADVDFRRILTPGKDLREGLEAIKAAARKRVENA